MRWNKLLSVGITVFVIFSLLTTSAIASQGKKEIEVTYSNISISYNNQLIAMGANLEPFMVNGTTFIPLRKAGEVFGKNIKWDGANNRVIVSDKAPAIDPSVVSLLQQQVKTKDNTIDQLEAEIDNLNRQLSDKDIEIYQLKQELDKLKEEVGDTTDLDSLESDLNDDYGDYEDIDVDISLRGDEDDVEVTIELDVDDWDWLTTSEQENLIEEIVEDILDEFDDADVEGSVVDDYDLDELATFETDSDGDVDITHGSSSSLDDLEDELNDDYEDYFTDIPVSIELSGDEDVITYDVNIRYDSYNDEWDDLSSTEVDRFLEYITDDIEDYYEDADIYGYVFDTDNNVILEQYEN